MIFDNYTAWEPVENLSTGLYFFELHNERGGLTILLKNFEAPNIVLKIKFEGVLAYRVVQEAGRLKTLNQIEIRNTFSTTTNSSYLKWFKEESSGIFDDWSLMHLVICNSDNLIDIITNQYPEVGWEPVDLK